MFKEYMPRGGWLRHYHREGIKGTVAGWALVIAMLLAYGLAGYIERGM